MAELFHPFPLDQLLQIVVQRARTQFVLPLGLAGDFLHDAVAVEVLAGKRKQNVEGGG